MPATPQACRAKGVLTEYYFLQARFREAAPPPPGLCSNASKCPSPHPLRSSAQLRVRRQRQVAGGHRRDPGRLLLEHLPWRDERVRGADHGEGRSLAAGAAPPRRYSVFGKGAGEEPASMAQHCVEEFLFRERWFRTTSSAPPPPPRGVGSGIPKDFPGSIPARKSSPRAARPPPPGARRGTGASGWRKRSPGTWIPKKCMCFCGFSIVTSRMKSAFWHLRTFRILSWVGARNLGIPAFAPRSEQPHARAPGAQMIRMASGSTAEDLK
eukprot:gene7008-biopygen20969